VEQAFLNHLSRLAFATPETLEADSFEGVRFGSAGNYFQLALLVFRVEFPYRAFHFSSAGIRFEDRYDGLSRLAAQFADVREIEARKGYSLQQYVCRLRGKARGIQERGDFFRCVVSVNLD